MYIYSTEKIGNTLMDICCSMPVYSQNTVCYTCSNFGLITNHEYIDKI